MTSLPRFPVVTGKRKAVQVVECPSETWKRPKRASQKSEIASSSGAAASTNAELRKELAEAYESVKEFAASNLTGKEKRQHDAKTIEALGGKASKQQSMPYNQLVAIKKARLKREQRAEEINKQADVVVGKRKRLAKTKNMAKLEKRKDADSGLHVTRGRFRRGVLDISKL